ncbi:MBL fold metallo-hydrolase [Methylovirgula sp. 4M-Z18]|uniref:MBL fold metallo-hydrolase n=1 Tax=Methylovirgula sp. 4M-Z18 TaxID=2293567 RepID=UPI000E2F26AC|nr:MBL fold metallo-hydrolase [Methylovirgula sp. 4M-Z18]RFB80543.1 MBL fold metallo-hydrolase [Methylovirgula sp. 4M-Z18]
MSVTFTILGCGSSGGVPRVGPSGWGACDPANPKNRRRRCSMLVERDDPVTGGRTSVLIDLSPDLREQLLGVGLMHLDAVLLTHAHADHIHGIDDVRPLVLQRGSQIDVHMDEPTAKIVLNNFSYIFRTPEGSLYSPLLVDRRLTPGRKCRVEGSGGAIEALPFRLFHGEVDALGFRFGNIAYTPDLNGIPDESLDALTGLDCWIIDALRYTPHPSHLSLSESLDWIDRLKPKQAILTNMHIDLDYATLKRELPAYVDVAYDGMRITS